MNRRKASLTPDLLLCVTGEATEGAGEDSWFYAVRDHDCIVSVFDGCGGIGSRRYENYSGRTGAYIASRAVSGAVENFFYHSGGEPVSVEKLQDAMSRALSVCRELADKKDGVKGRLTRAFPTTSAIISARPNGRSIAASCFWAGDSRCYMLDTKGLRQFSRDDTESDGALSSISDDSVLKNVINASEPFGLHDRRIDITQPCLLFTATDGCYGYLKSPMHFEYLLLDTLISSGCISEWRERLGLAFAECAGDDFTLCLMGYGYGSFHDMKSSFSGRIDHLLSAYRLDTDDEDIDSEWETYKITYLI